MPPIEASKVGIVESRQGVTAANGQTKDEETGDDDRGIRFGAAGTSGYGEDALLFGGSSTAATSEFVTELPTEEEERRLQMEDDDDDGAAAASHQLPIDEGRVSHHPSTRQAILVRTENNNSVFPLLVLFPEFKLLTV